IESCWKS
ncbi:hypothetical protein CISIN_1g0110412mg, partial [Citrus sinensis]